MNRPNKTRHIYFELKKLMGEKFFAFQLLKSAALFVDIADVAEENNPITAEQVQDFYVPYTEKGVDEVIAENIRMFHSQEDWWIQEEVSEVDERIKQKYYYELEVAA